jgi:two-component system, sensor histidine kinase and response regulator
MSESLYQERPRLLVVDDEPYNLQLLTRIFQRTCEVEKAVDGREALQKLADNQYDVVLLDIMMPEIGGLDVLKIIRSSADLAELPVVLISALGDKDEIIRGIRLGANDYITKPVDLDVVQARVSTQVKIKQLRDERARMISLLQAANEMKARMMQVASHDLKNPLNNLQMLTQVMRKQAEDNPKLSKLLNMQQDSLDAILRVVLDFLDSSISTSNQINISLRALDCVSVVRQVLNQYSVAAHNKQISLEHAPIEGVIVADDSRLAQVLGNLVSNAIKYSPKGGRVQVATEKQEKRWRLTVRDSGMGIPEEEQEFLFKPFSKNEISTKPTDGESCACRRERWACITIPKAARFSGLNCRWRKKR